MLSMVIAAAKAKGNTSASAAAARRATIRPPQWLMEQGIESVSLNPDTVVDTGWRWRAKAG